MSGFDFHAFSLARFSAAPAQLWSSSEIRLLRQLAQQGVPPSVIARQLRRSESAIRNKAGMHGISLQRKREPAVETG